MGRRLRVMVVPERLRKLEDWLAGLDRCDVNENVVYPRDVWKHVVSMIELHGLPMQMVVKCSGYSSESFASILYGDGYCEEIRLVSCGYNGATAYAATQIVLALLGRDPEKEDDFAELLNSLVFSNPALLCRGVGVRVDRDTVYLDIYVPNGCEC